MAKLVDNANETAFSEQLLGLNLEDLVPRYSVNTLISGPFKYGPWVNRPSRFRPVGGHGVFYSAFDIKTALIEHAWHRKQFLDDYNPKREIKALTLQVFSVKVSGQVIDASHDDFKEDLVAWLDKHDYSDSQSFATKVKAAQLDAIKYPSVRHPVGTCLAVLEQSAIVGEPLEIDNNWWLSFSGSQASFIHDRLVGTGESFSYHLS